MQEPGNEHRSLTQTVADQLRDQIRQGTYTSQKYLPPERSLQELFNVSRVTVRRALDDLEQSGWIERQPGRGSLVLKQQPQSSESPSDRKTILFVAWSMQYPDNVEYANAIMDICHQHGYACVIFDSQAGQVDMPQLLERVNRQWVEAVIWLGYPIASQQAGIEKLLSQRIPVVCLDRKPVKSGVDMVVPDHFSGAYAATTHLLEQWGGPVYYLGMHDKPTSARSRYMGYCNAMRSAGYASVDNYVIHAGVDEWEAARKFVDVPWEASLPISRELLASADRPLAVVCDGDYVAYALYIAACEAGLKIGEDLGLTGFSCRQLGALVKPQLTTVGPYVQRVAARATELAIHRAQGMDSAVSTELIPILLNVRGSSIKDTAQAMLPQMPAGANIQIQTSEV